jgi:hypothetical protein
LTLEQVLQKLLAHDVAAHGMGEAGAEDVYAFKQLLENKLQKSTKFCLGG